MIHLVDIEDEQLEKKQKFGCYHISKKIEVLRKTVTIRNIVTHTTPRFKDSI